MKRESVKTIVVLAGLAAGCASDEALQSTLDDRGATWTRIEDIVTLARPAPRFSAAARDYLYIAPIETDSRGRSRHYLWVGLGTTVDRTWHDVRATPASSLMLVVDGEPIALTLADWEDDARPELYDTPAPVYEVRRASVSLDQVERVARASSVEVHVVTDGGAVAPYELWDGAWSDWRVFAGTPLQTRE
jgi:hypothetical protein